MVHPSQVLTVLVGTASALSGLIAENPMAAITTLMHLANMETPLQFAVRYVP